MLLVSCRRPPSPCAGAVRHSFECAHVHVHGHGASHGQPAAMTPTLRVTAAADCSRDTPTHTRTSPPSLPHSIVHAHAHARAPYEWQRIAMGSQKGRGRADGAGGARRRRCAALRWSRLVAAVLLPSPLAVVIACFARISCVRCVCSDVTDRNRNPSLAAWGLWVRCGGQRRKEMKGQQAGQRKNKSEKQKRDHVEETNRNSGNGKSKHHLPQQAHSEHSYDNCIQTYQLASF